MAESPRCELCGEPMPDGEEMFKFHGYSGNCPKPPMQKTEVVAEYIFRDMRDGEFLDRYQDQSKTVWLARTIRY